MAHIPDYADEAAFPRDHTLDKAGNPLMPEQWGLTKREYIATAMMQTIMQGASATPELLDQMLQLASKCAVQAADALLTELANSSR